MFSLDLAARLGGLPRPYWWLWLGLVLNRGGQFVQPLLTFYLVDARGFSLSQAAAAIASWGVGSVAGALLSGVVADRIGRRAAMIGSALGSALALQILRVAATPVEVSAAVMLLALIYDLHRPAVFAMVADLVPASERVRAYSLLYVAVNLGFAGAPAIAGWLAGRDYALIFYAASAIQLFWAAWILLVLPETRPVPVAAARPASLMTALSDHVYMGFLAVCTLIALLPHQSFVALSAWMGQQGHSAATFGSVIALNGVLIVLIQPWAARSIGRADGPRVFAAACLLYGVGFALHGQGSSLTIHRLAIVVWTLGEIVSSPVMSGVVASLAPEEARGRYQGLMATSFAIAGIGAPLMGAAVMERWGGEVLWTGCLGVGVLGAVMIGLLGPHLRARMAGARR